MAKKPETNVEPIEASFGDVLGAMVEKTTSAHDADDMLIATHLGILPIGGLQLECYFLEDGHRVFHKRGMAKALGVKSEGGNAFMKTLSSKGLGSELEENLGNKINNPIVFKALGSDPAHGFDAEVLVDVCKAVLRAKSADKLTKSQDTIAA